MATRGRLCNDFTPLQTFDKLNLFIRHLKTKLVLLISKAYNKKNADLNFHLNQHFHFLTWTKLPSWALPFQMTFRVLSQLPPPLLLLIPALQEL